MSKQEVEIKLSLSRLIQIVTMVITLAGAYYTLRIDIASNTNTVTDMDKRLRVLEDSRTAQLEEVNKNMLSKIFGKNNE